MPNLKSPSYIKSYINRFTKEKKRKKILSKIPIELDAYEKELLCEIFISSITMEPLTRLINTALSIVHVIEQDIKGDFVECGVYKGGQGALAAGIFSNRKQHHRKIFLFDTYSGATKPGKEDVRISTGDSAISKWMQTNGNWMNSGIKEVRNNLKKLGVLNENVKFIIGDVQKTLMEKNNISKEIAILRLDTNQYNSTKIELETLYPNLNKSGVLIVNDYGFWAGTKKAVDEYFSDKNSPFFLSVDSAARVGSKP